MYLVTHQNFEYNALILLMKPTSPADSFFFVVSYFGTEGCNFSPNFPDWIFGMKLLF